MIPKIVPIVASVTLIGSASLTAYADDMLDKDYTPTGPFGGLSKESGS